MIHNMLPRAQCLYRIWDAALRFGCSRVLLRGLRVQLYRFEVLEEGIEKL